MRVELKLLVIVLALTVAAPLNASSQPASLNTPTRTAHGATFTTPAGWIAADEDATLKSSIRLKSPDGQLDIAIIETTDAADASAAVTAAFQRYDPGVARSVKFSAAMAADNGWDEQVGFVMAQRSGVAGVLCQVIAYRHGRSWTTMIVEGTTASFEKRASAIALVRQSFRAPGYSAEDVSGNMPLKLDSTRIALLKKFVTDSMRELQIPGVAIALVDARGPRYVGGFGVRDQTSKQPQFVDADTLFQIASNTKGMTTLMLAKLVDEGKFAWNQPVTQVYPAFRTGDPALTAKVEMRHLVCACTGIPRKDFPIGFSGSPDMPSIRIFDFLADTKPTSALGETFQYSNLMAAAAGLIGGHVAEPSLEIGAAFDKSMKERVFDPLGMHATTLDPIRAKAGDHASGHGQDLAGNTVLVDPVMNLISYPFRPSGGVWSNARDMARYVLNEVTPGRPAGGKRIYSAANVMIRRQPSISLGENGSYGMGLANMKIAGVDVIHHGGDVFGFKSDIYVVPAAGIGAVLLTNADSGGLLLTPFARRLVELTYSARPTAADEVRATALRARTLAAGLSASLVYPAKSEAIELLAPRYDSPDLGPLRVSQRNNQLRFDFAAWGSPMASRRNPDGSTSFVTAVPGFIGVEFLAATRDGKRVLIVRESQHEYVYSEPR